MPAQLLLDRVDGATPSIHFHSSQQSILVIMNLKQEDCTFPRHSFAWALNEIEVGKLSFRAYKVAKSCLEPKVRVLVSGKVGSRQTCVKGRDFWPIEMC